MKIIEFCVLGERGGSSFPRVFYYKLFGADIKRQFQILGGVNFEVNYTEFFFHNVHTEEVDTFFKIILNVEKRLNKFCKNFDQK